MIARLPIRRLPHAADLALPGYQTPGSAGLDLTVDTFDFGDGTSGYACELAPGQRVLALTGVFAAIPEGMVGLVCPRSGLALRHGVTVLNAPGIIDSDYRGEIGVILVNFGATVFHAESGVRIAQLVLVPFARVEVHEVPELPDTSRGSGGFGSTGG
jgi:dUTP pyrophosphatase